MGLPEEQTTPALAHDADRTETSSQAKSEELRTVEEKEMAQAQSEKSTMGGNVEYTTEAERLLAIRESKYLSGKKLALVFGGMLLAVFLVALDQTILAPAFPFIASEFQALDQLSWIASAYFLTQAAFLLLYGQALTLFSLKRTFLFAITLFELGSIICAAAPNVDVLIFGRAFAGVGAAGIFVSVLSIVSEITRLEQRPKLFGLFGAVFAVSSVVGPLLGGAFTDLGYGGWRICFWINLPFGAITIAAVSFILKPQPTPPVREEVILQTERKIARWTRGTWKPSPKSFLFKLAILDWTGALIMLGLITCLLLALQWGGVKYAWGSGEVIGLLVAFAALVVIFVLYEWKFAGASATLPLRLLKNRTQVGAILAAFFIMFVLLLGTYYLPFYFQAAKGQSATQSGVAILPFMLGIVFAAGASGGAVSYFGYYKPFLVFGPWLMCIGSGLLYTIKVDTSNSMLIGYQIILSLGVGAVLQNTLISVQADIADEADVPQASALVTFGQLIGGTIGIAISSSLFATELGKNLVIYAPEAPFELVRQSVTVIASLPAEMQPGVIEAYVRALNVVYIIGVPAGILASLAGLLTRNVSVKGKDMMAGGA